MAKLPVAGRVKRRLARDIGTVPATRFSRHTLAAVSSRLAKDRRWRTLLAVEPASSLASAAWPAGLPRNGQRRGDLGRRMQDLFATLPPGPVVLIGSDIPAAGAEHIAAAFRLLGRHDAVFGPATDGGYWLVGLRRRPKVPAIFANVRWSSATALRDTLANLVGSPVGFVATLADVDCGADHRASRALHGRRVLPRVLRCS